MRFEEKDVHRVAMNASLSFLWERLVENWMKEVSAQSSFLEQLMAKESTFEKLGIRYIWFERQQGVDCSLVGVQFWFPLGGSQAYWCQEIKTSNQESRWLYHPLSNNQFEVQQQRDGLTERPCCLSFTF